MSAISGSTTTNPASGADPFSAFSSGEFLELIFTELTNQDPLAPNETKDLIDQISTIRAIESDTQLTDKFEDLLRQNDLTVSSTLIGKFVTGIDENDFRVASFVDSVSITRSGTVLNLSDGTRVPIEQVDEVIDPALISFTEPDEPDLVEGADDESGDESGEEG